AWRRRQRARRRRAGRGIGAASTGSGGRRARRARRRGRRRREPTACRRRECHDITPHASGDARRVCSRRRSRESTVHLYLLRHGQTAATRENRFSGNSDPPLTDVGRRMAEAFARAYAARKWTAIYVSPMTRTRETAAPICAAAALQPIE